MATRPLTPPAPASFNESRQGLPRLVNNQSQGRFPITSATAGGWSFLSQIGTYVPASLGPSLITTVQVAYVLLFSNDRPVNIESRYSVSAVVTGTGFTVRGNIGGQPAALVGEGWSEADYWPDLIAPEAYGDPGRLAVPTPPGDSQRYVEGYPVVLTPGALPTFLDGPDTNYVQGDWAVVVHTESSVSHGKSAKQFAMAPGGGAALTVGGSCILAVEDFTPAVQAAGHIEFALPGGYGETARLNVVGVYQSAVYGGHDPVPAAIARAMELERTIL